MPKRTTIELDEELLARAKRALGRTTTRATVEEALRRVSDQAESEHRQRAERQTRYLRQLHKRVDIDVLALEEMWR